MKFSYNWLKELSGTEKTAEEVAELFLTHSFEVEGIEKQGENLKNVVVGEILSVEEHPDADRLNIAEVCVSDNKNSTNQKLQTKNLTIVCGAPNLKVGQKVPVALIGAKLQQVSNKPQSSDGAKQSADCFEIKKSKIRGVESNGMICAEDELGLGNEHEGIIVLNENAKVGDAFAKHMNLNACLPGRDDEILEIDILPNRGHDCLSHRGVAGELMALENIECRMPKVETLPLTEKKMKISITTPNCSRYIGMKIDNIKIGSSPVWMQARLRACGMQPINNIVDITNYVMLETGQPLHAFSAQGGNATSIEEILIRQANDEEKLVLLDDQEIELTKDDMVITDGENPIALAGVMGGKESGITDQTESIILESASFNSTAVRFTARRHNIQSDAAYRFERNIDPNLAAVGMARAISLIGKFCDGKIEVVSDSYPDPVTPWNVDLEIESIEKLLGVAISKKESVDILGRLGMSVKETEEKFVVTVPTCRIDLQTKEDLIEEIGRVYGYNKTKSQPLIETIQAPKRNEQRFFERRIKDICVGNGFDEMRGYSFYSRNDATALGLDDEAHVALLNPASPEQAVMRRTLTAHLLRAGKKNFSYFDAVRIFEIGRIYDPTDKTLPDEKLVLGVAVLLKGDGGEQFFELKGLVDTLLSNFGVGDYYFDDVFDENDENIINLHPSRKALVKTDDGEKIGWVGEVDRTAHKHFGIKQARVAVFELEVDTLLQKALEENFYEPLAKFPFVERDISMIVEEQTRVADMERAIYGVGGKLVKNVDLFDLFVNEEKGQRSMAFRIIFGADNRTLENKEINEVMKKIIDELEKNPEVEVKK